ncbi:MAG: hypothetical protein RRY35_05270, partial [Clostridiales bacterium]
MVLPPRSSDILLKNLRFTQDITAEGCFVPMLLLREYRRLNLSETELIILLRLLFLRQSHQALYPGDVAAEFCCSVEEAQALLSPFIDSGLVDDYEQGAFYQLDGLY